MFANKIFGLASRILAIALLASASSCTVTVGDDDDDNNGGQNKGKGKVGVAVDLGLPSGTKWASWNVGASSETEAGWMISWGNTKEVNDCSEGNCPTHGYSIDELESKGYTSSGNLVAKYDAATANWGSDWRMPTSKDVDELIKNCTISAETVDGVAGYRVTGKNGNSIFMCTAGVKYGISTSLGITSYWTSSVYDGTLLYKPDDDAFIFSVQYKELSRQDRPCGLPVRPVKD